MRTLMSKSYGYVMRPAVRMISSCTIESDLFAVPHFNLYDPAA